MLRVKPFAALRPQPMFAAEVASVPYDVVDADEARRLVQGRPRSCLRVERSEVDLDPEVDPYSSAVYQRAADNLRELERSALMRESAGSLYLYRQETTLLGARVRQTAVVGCCHVDDVASAVIKRHEHTRREKEDDRTRHLLAVRANTGPVFLMYRDDAALAALVAIDSDTEPLYDFVAPDGVRHSVWRVARPAEYSAALQRLPGAYIADGHHRTASAVRAAAELRARGAEQHGEREHEWFMAALFPASELTILPYHRVLRDLGGLSASELVERLERVARVEATERADPKGPGSFGMYLAGRWYRVTLPRSVLDGKSPVASLDYALLDEHIARPLLGILDLRSDPRIDFVGGIRGTAELERRVDSGRDAVAFAMQPTSVEQLLRVADAGQVMPPKSTWFEPKLRSGLLIHTFD